MAMPIGENMAAREALPINAIALPMPLIALAALPAAEAIFALVIDATIEENPLATAVFADNMPVLVVVASQPMRPEA